MSTPETNETEKIATIVVEVTKEEERKAKRVDFIVALHGTSLFTGNEATKKTREVARLSNQLIEIGLTENDIFVEDIKLTATTGLVNRSSTATYYLRIRCPKLELVPDILGVITSQKSVIMKAMEWGYQHEDEIRQELLNSCLAATDAKAQCIANGLRTQLLGIQSFSERYDDGDPQTRVEFYLRDPATKGLNFSRSRAKRLTPDIGLVVLHAKRVAMKLCVHYRVGGFEPQPSPA